jgi:hypothetical protein
MTDDLRRVVARTRRWLSRDWRCGLLGHRLPYAEQIISGLGLMYRCRRCYRGVVFVPFPS